MRMTGWIKLVVVGVALNGTALARAGAQNQATPLSNLFGSWQLDAARSDDPEQKIEEARTRLTSGVGGRFARKGGGGTPGFTPLPDRFELVQVGDTLTFVDRGMRMRAVVVGGSVKASSAHGVPLAPGLWKDGKLRVEGKGARGASVFEVWDLMDDGETLRRATRVNLPRGKGTIDWAQYYQRAAPDASQAPREPAPSSKDDGEPR